MCFFFFFFFSSFPALDHPSLHFVLFLCMPSLPPNAKVLLLLLLLLLLPLLLFWGGGGLWPT